jgi:hypothetical protein
MNVPLLTRTHLLALVELKLARQTRSDKDDDHAPFCAVVLRQALWQNGAVGLAAAKHAVAIDLMTSSSN